MFGGSLPAQAVHAPPPPAPAVLLKILTENGIGPDNVLTNIKGEQNKGEETGKNEQVEKDKSAQTSAMSSQMARVIRWNVPGLYKKSAQTFKRKTDNPDILIKNENGKTKMLRVCFSW